MRKHCLLSLSLSPLRSGLSIGRLHNIIIISSLWAIFGKSPSSSSCVSSMPHSHVYVCQWDPIFKLCGRIGYFLIKFVDIFIALCVCAHRISFVTIWTIFTQLILEATVIHIYLKYFSFYFKSMWIILLCLCAFCEEHWLAATQRVIARNQIIENVHEFEAFIHIQ